MPKEKEKKQPSPEVAMFEIPYYVSNNGDGSASIQLCKSQREAEKQDEEQSESWGESSAGTISAKIENGKLYYQMRDDNYQRVWVEAKKAK